MSVRNTTENVLSQWSLPGERGLGEAGTNPNKWVHDHLVSVLELKGEDTAIDRLTPAFISERLRRLGGGGRLATRLFIAPVSHQSSGKGLGNQEVILSRAGLTHARTGVITEKGEIDRSILDGLIKFLETRGGRIGARDLGVWLDERFRPTVAGEIEGFSRWERFATRFLLAPVEWGLLLAAVGGKITADDVRGLYDHSIFPRLRAERAAVTVLDSLQKSSPASGSEHTSKILGPEVERLIAWAGGVPSGADPTSVAKAAAYDLLEGAPKSRIAALRGKQGFPIGRVGLSTAMLLCPFFRGPTQAKAPQLTPS